jgi:hypothetical protein
MHAEYFESKPRIGDNLEEMGNHTPLHVRYFVKSVLIFV